ncbi:MAG: DnaJ domain-containing protein [Nitrospirae bacterium]|nr:DnaJ domain-containing protein [Candidatus Manganitrophaceae bacterium]
MSVEVPLSGPLREGHLASIFSSLQKKQATGILRVRLNDVEKTVYMSEGKIIFATSRYPDDRLGLLLLKRGKLTYLQYETVVQIYEASLRDNPRLRQGTILLKQGFLTPKELYDAVMAQATEIILGLFTWTDGDYQFKECLLPSRELITLNISTATLILQGIRRITDWTRLAGGLPPFDRILQLTKDPKELFQMVHLEPDETALLSRLNGMTIRELLIGSSLPAFETLRLLYFFVSVGIAEVTESTPESFSSWEERYSTTQRIITEEIRATIDEKERHPASSIDQIRDAYRKLGSQNYYEILGVGEQATREEMKRAYYRLAKVYHPDRYFEESMRELKGELETLFEKLKEAYDVLISDQSRALYNARRLDPPNPNPARPVTAAEQAERSFNDGKRAYEAKDYLKAVERFEAAARIMPNNPLYLGALGKALLFFPERLRRAEMAFQQAVTIDPSRVDDAVELARIYEGQGMIRRAVKIYEEAFTRAPEHPAVKEGLSRLKAKV